VAALEEEEGGESIDQRSEEASKLAGYHEPTHSTINLDNTY